MLEERRGYYGVMILILENDQILNSKVFDEINESFVEDHALFERLSIIILNPEFLPDSLSDKILEMNSIYLNAK
jgi:hypothetical protein